MTSVLESPAALASPTFGWFARRGLVAGGLGGLAGAVFLWLVGEGTIRQALAVEAASEADHGHERFSRGVQVVGGGVAAVLYGLVLGLIFTAVFASQRHRLGGGDDFGRSLRLAGAALGALVLVPALKYPPNPPAVGDPDTVNQRTVAYLTLMAFAGLMMLGSVALVRWLASRGARAPVALAVSGLAVMAAVAVAWTVWPAGDPLPADMPAGLVWRFRVQSIGGLALQWATIGTVFGLLVSRPARAGGA